MPFVLLIVFATNLRPTDLVDEAFLRRIHYKVFAENPTRQDFKKIFERCCEERGIPYDETGRRQPPARPTSTRAACSPVAATRAI